MGKVVGFQPFLVQRPAESSRPIGYRHDGFRRDRVIMGPVLDMLFRPEEVHPASGLPPRGFAGQHPGEADVYVADNSLRIDFENSIISHPQENWLPTIQATRIYAYLGAGKKPAHGQRFQASLAVPLLLPPYGDEVMGGHIRKRCPRLHVIRVPDKP